MGCHLSHRSAGGAWAVGVGKSRGRASDRTYCDPYSTVIAKKVSGVLLVGMGKKRAIINLAEY